MTSSHFSSSEERWRLEKNPLAWMSWTACKEDEKRNRKIKVAVDFLQKRKKYPVQPVIYDKHIMEVEIWHAATGVKNM